MSDRIGICDCCWTDGVVIVEIELPADWAGFLASQSVNLCPDCAKMQRAGEEP